MSEDSEALAPHAQGGTERAALGAQARATAASAVDLAADALRLLALETRLAGLSLAGILFSALTAAFTAMSLWLLLQSLVVVGLLRYGADLLWTLLGLAAANLALGALLLLVIRRLSRNLLFRATGQALWGARDETDRA